MNFKGLKAYSLFSDHKGIKQEISNRKICGGNSLAVLWLGLWAFTAEGLGSIPGWGTRISQAVWHGQKKKKREKERYVENPQIF